MSKLTDDLNAALRRAKRAFAEIEGACDTLTAQARHNALPNHDTAFLAGQFMAEVHNARGTLVKLEDAADGRN